MVTQRTFQHVVRVAHTKETTLYNYIWNNALSPSCLGTYQQQLLIHEQDCYVHKVQ